MRSFFTSWLLPSLQLSRLQPLRFKAAEEWLRGLRGVGEEGEREGVGVVGEEEDGEGVAGGVGEEDWLLCKGKEEARCSRRRR